MNKVISTLPLSPRQNPDIGYFSIPLIADIVASFIGVSTLNAVNTLGAKRATIQDVNAHFIMLKHLNLASQFKWNDRDEAWTTVLNNLFHTGFIQGWAFQDKRTIMICPCGKTEFIAAKSTLSEIHGKRKVYEVRNGKVFCFLCKGVVASIMAPCLLIRLPDRVPFVTVIPAYAAIEWNGLATDFSNREILVSRIRETGIQLEYSDNRYNIDVDFAWKLLPERLHSRNIYCLGLIVGHKTIKHALSMVLLNSLIGVPIPEFVISTPYLSLDFGDQSPIGAEKLLDLYGVVPLRWLLSMAIGCTRKELTLQSKLIYLIKHSIGTTLNVLNNDLESVSPDVIWNLFNKERIQKILSYLRQGKPENLEPIEYRLASLLGLNRRI